MRDGNTIKNVDYLDGFQYAGGILQFFPHAEGYVKATPQSNTPNGEPTSYTYNYVFNYTDHLGNVRVSYSKDPATNQLKILEENHYYPFGLKHSAYGTGSKRDFMKGIDPSDPPVRLEYVLETEYQYKYNGQEFQDELGLNWYNYRYRNYDPAIGRFMGVDPISEDYYNISTYQFAHNNPVWKIEIEGLEGAPTSGTDIQSSAGHGRTIFSDADFYGDVRPSTSDQYDENPIAGFMKDAYYVSASIGGLDAVDNVIESLQDGTFTVELDPVEISFAVVTAGKGGGGKSFFGKIWNGIKNVFGGTKTSTASGGAKETTKEIIERKTKGGDGATSKHILEKDSDGNTVSKTHQVEKDGEVIHQHQNHISTEKNPETGKHNTRQFPDEWVEYPEK